MSREKSVRERILFSRSRDQTKRSEYNDVVLRKNLYEHRRLDVSNDVEKRARDVVSKGLSHDQKSIVKDFKALQRQRSALDFQQYLQKNSQENAALKTSRSYAHLNNAISQAKLSFSKMEDKIDVSKLAPKPPENVQRREESETIEKADTKHEEGAVSDTLDETTPDSGHRSVDEFINFLSTPKNRSSVLNTRTRVQKEHQSVGKKSSGARPKSSLIRR